MNVLFMGFSVLSRHLYDDINNTYIPGIRTKAFGLGGHHYNHLYPWFDQVLDDENPDVVILDLSSTPCRAWTTEVMLRRNIRTMLWRLKKSGVRVGFIHFYRKDYNPQEDLLLNVVNRIAKNHHLPIYDFATWSTQLPEKLRKEVYFDGVHFSEFGSSIAIKRLQSIATDFLNPELGLIKKNIVPDENISSIKTIPVRELISNEKDYRFRQQERYGVKSEVVQIEEGNTIKLTPPQGHTIIGMYVVLGPKSGYLQIETIDDTTEQFKVYDQFCYYTRLQCITLKHIKLETSVNVMQLPSIPKDVILQKGSQDLSPRVGEIGYILLKRVL